ncbi:hypothetical protein [Paraburkholderia diazotrophica]|uniref:hypothetical protein n=1 Tax=Paraburkholderia diazotrophica TaxID=667676 RepID=UPI00317DBC1C
MNVFFATTRGGVVHYLSAKSKLNNVHLWVNGGVDLTDIDLKTEDISVFDKTFDLKDEKQFEAAVGTIEEHYDECIVWVEA